MVYHHLEKVTSRMRMHFWKLAWKRWNRGGRRSVSPSAWSLKRLFPYNESEHSLRNSDKFKVNFAYTENYRKSIIPYSYLIFVIFLHRQKFTPAKKNLHGHVRGDRDKYQLCVWVIKMMILHVIKNFPAIIALFLSPCGQSWWLEERLSVPPLSGREDRYRWILPTTNAQEIAPFVQRPACLHITLE